MVKPSQILLESSLWLPAEPFLALDALLPVGVRLDQAGINRRAFAANQPLRMQPDRLEDARQNSFRGNSHAGLEEVG